MSPRFRRSLRRPLRRRDFFASLPPHSHPPSFVLEIHLRTPARDGASSRARRTLPECPSRPHIIAIIMILLHLSDDDDGGRGRRRRSYVCFSEGRIDNACGWSGCRRRRSISSRRTRTNANIASASHDSLASKKIRPRAGPAASRNRTTFYMFLAANVSLLRMDDLHDQCRLV